MLSRNFDRSGYFAKTRRCVHDSVGLLKAIMQSTVSEEYYWLIGVTVTREYQTVFSSSPELSLFSSIIKSLIYSIQMSLSQFVQSIESNCEGKGGRGDYVRCSQLVHELSDFLYSSTSTDYRKTSLITPSLSSI